MLKMAGKNALITGAAGGLGAAIARQFIGEGARVTLADVDVNACTDLATRLGPQAAAVHLDVADEQSWQRALEQVPSGLTTVVTAAGISLHASIDATSMADLRRLVEINLVGTFLGIQLGARVMTGPGSIITISSVNGVLATTNLSAYAATKFAVCGVSRIAALELAPRGIRVNSICPGSIVTPITDSGGFDTIDWDAYVRTIPAGRRGQPEEVGRAAVYLASDDSDYVTGTELVIDGGVAAGRIVP